MLARVSSIETFRRWRQNEDADAQALIDALTLDEPSEAMLAGTAFHAAMENVADGDVNVISHDGYVFHLNVDVSIELPKAREIRARKDYGPLTVTGKFDALDGKTIIDHKTTSRFDAERYVSGYQWRYYLDIFDCDVFRWNVFEMRKIESTTVGVDEYDVFAFHRLEQSRYPGMHDDCLQLALDFYNVVAPLLPEYQSRLEAA